MSSIGGISGASWVSQAVQKSTEDEKTAASSFSEKLDEMKNPSKSKEKSSSGGSDSEETTTTIERSVITGPDGSQIVVFTQITVDASGKQIESKVISRQKIGSGTGQDGSKETEAQLSGMPKAGEVNDGHTTLNQMAERARREYEDHSTVDSVHTEMLFKANI